MKRNVCVCWFSSSELNSLRTEEITFDAVVNSIQNGKSFQLFVLVDSPRCLDSFSFSKWVFRFEWYFFKSLLLVQLLLKIQLFIEESKSFVTMTNIIIRYDGGGKSPQEIHYQFDEKQSLDKQLVTICEQLKCIGLPSNYTLQSVETNNILQAQVSWNEFVGFSSSDFIHALTIANCCDILFLEHFCFFFNFRFCSKSTEMSLTFMTSFCFKSVDSY